MSGKRIVVLGCTGSIGQQTLDVVRRHPGELSVVGLACGTRTSDMLVAAAEFGVQTCVAGAGQESAFEGELPAGMSLGFGDEALIELVRSVGADLVVNALVGAAGLRASYETLRAGHVLALANKESLVVAGELLCSVPCTDPASLIRPIDSEHGAIWQCLLGESESDVAALWVTASGGPFRGRTRDELTHVTPDEALAHPTWNMGPKITIDSATLMNKGLEVIEAHHLFAMPYEKIRVVVQPQSAIHSMVEFSDGSVKAHLGTTDMRIPIQFALSYPKRWDAPVDPIDFCALGQLDFAAPDTGTFRCLELARDAGQAGGTLPAAMNAANEVAVAAFLNRRLSFLGIADCVEAAMDAHCVDQVTSIEQLFDVNARSRAFADNWIQKKSEV